tara:strand:- start:811 stop:987 length:177 start_codon:yes stop_codon:yes gene_type:complete
MPEDIAAAFNQTAVDDSVHVVVLTGAGRGLCSGYDLNTFCGKTRNKSGNTVNAVGRND